MMFAMHSLVLLTSVAVAGDVQLCVFGSTWCEPCKQMRPAVAQLANEGYAIQTIDIDRDPAAAARFRISSVPVVMLFKNGQVVDRIDHSMSYAQLTDLLRRHRVTPVATVRGQSPATPGLPASAALTPPAGGLREPPLGRMPLLQSTNARQGGTSRGSAQASLDASVRLRVEDNSGHSFGSGTVIDVHDRDALVLTCAHIFRDSQGQGQIIVQRFDTAQSQDVEGTLISYDYDLDVALVGIKLETPMRPAPLAQLSRTVSPGEAVYSIGCNHGQTPTVINGKVNAVNKYIGPANLTASGRPVDGRSGGGLFNQVGQLIGVCNAADPELDEGLYAALPRIHKELDRNGLSFIYQNEQPATQLASASAAVAPAKSLVPEPTRLAVHNSTVAQSDYPVMAATANQSTSPMATGQHGEMVCILRSSGDNGQSRVFVVRQPSLQLLQRLKDEASGPN